MTKDTISSKFKSINKTTGSANLPKLQNKSPQSTFPIFVDAHVPSNLFKAASTISLPNLNEKKLSFENSTSNVSPHTINSKFVATLSFVPTEIKSAQEIKPFIPNQITTSKSNPISKKRTEKTHQESSSSVAAPAAFMAGITGMFGIANYSVFFADLTEQNAMKITGIAGIAFATFSWLVVKLLEKGKPVEGDSPNNQNKN